MLELKNLFVLSLLILSTMSRANSKKIYWLAYGDLRGNIEACGCDPRTDLGGLIRLATFVKRERGIHPKLMLFDLGNNISTAIPPSLKDETILDGLDKIRADAFLLNYREIKAFKSKKTNLRSFVLSNGDFKGVNKFIKLKSAIILGFVEPKKGHKNLSNWDKRLHAEWKEIVGKNKASILLFSGTDKTLEKILSTRLFTEIISSSPRKDGEVSSFYEKENPESLFRKARVRSVPIDGLGVLRGGALQEKEARSLSELLQDNGLRDKTNKSEFFINNKLKLVTWLDHRYEGSSLKTLMKEYNLQLKNNFKTTIKERKKSLKNTKFVGAQSCKSCHVKAYKAWEESSHAKALTTLELKGKDMDSKCVSCHVLGFNEGGFVSKDVTPQFAGVQCENCHGPRLAHTKNPTIKRFSVKSTTHGDSCKSCHHDPHTANFVFDKYWAKIKHGK